MVSLAACSLALLFDFDHSKFQRYHTLNLEHTRLAIANAKLSSELSVELIEISKIVNYDERMKRLDVYRARERFYGTRQQEINKLKFILDVIKYRPILLN